MEVICVLHRESAAVPSGEDLEGPPEDRWEAVLRALEGIGAAVESERLGEAFFAADGLRDLHGDRVVGVLAAAREAVGVEAAVGRGRTRLAALSAARGVTSPLRLLPVAALVDRLAAPSREAADLLTTMERLGIATLGSLAALSRDRVADRFGPLGLRAHGLARGEEEPLRPREPHEELVEEISLPEGTAGDRLERALELLVDRLLAAPRRRGRTLLGLRLGALLGEGRSWSVFQGLGRPTASARVLRTVLAPRLEELPAPALTLRLRAVGLGPPAADQLELSMEGAEPRRRRLGAAVREVRAAQGGDALLRALPVDEGSRIPERRLILTPFPEP
jgi:protein ImuB